jgi:hypothetical protein
MVMILSTFARPGDEHVIEADYCLTTRVNGKKIFVTLEPSCWVGRKSKLGISVSGKNLGGGIIRGRKFFSNATKDDLIKLINQIQLTSCSVKKCKNMYIKGYDEHHRNPHSFCDTHRLKEISNKARQEEHKIALEQKAVDLEKKEKGYRYKATIWIHRNDSDDRFIYRYFKIRPLKRDLTIIASAAGSEISDDYSISKL